MKKRIAIAHPVSAAEALDPGADISHIFTGELPPNIEIVTHVEADDWRRDSGLPLGLKTPEDVAKAYAQGVITEQEGDAFLAAIRKRRGR